MNHGLTGLRRILYIIPALLLVLSASPTVGVAAVDDSESTGGSGAGSGLRVTTSDQMREVGRFDFSSTTIDYTSAAGRKNVASATVSVGRKKFSITMDRANGTAQWSGNGATLVPEETRALAALGRSFDSRWAVPARANEAQLPMQQNLVLRFAMLLAEAPAGIPLETYDAPRTKEWTGDHSSPGDALVVDSCTEQVNTAVKNGGDGIAAARACQRSDEENIRYTRCNKRAWTQHDSNGHCFLGESLFVGPRAAGCMGKCGGGCFVVTGFTYDCSDHDRCGRVHGGSTNPWDSECGDEYFEADDDFLWSSDQCD